jgi:uridine kinase
MKVKDLIKEIEECKAEYPDFMDWDVFTEQINEIDKKSKKNNPQWKWLKDSEDWEYLECAGYWTKFPKEKVFTINVNY